MWIGRRRSFEAKRDLVRDAAVHQPLRVLPSLPVMVVVVVAILAGGAMSMWLLGVWEPAPATPSAGEQLRLERIKTALTVAAGIGAAATLMIALRRQAVSERAQRFTEEDARQQRITSLYLASVEQLGSERAAVRLGGLYALERLGNENPELRQTVVDVICAYLRMPYVPPSDLLGAAHQPAVELAAKSETGGGASVRQELQVRLAAQRLLVVHLQAKPEADTPRWVKPNGAWLDVNLADAVLIQPAFTRCRVGSLDLSRASMYGYSDFRWVSVRGDATFDDVHFFGYADFNKARLKANLSLTGVTFHANASLEAVQVHGKIDLSQSRFLANLYASGATFKDHFDLTGVRISGSARFNRTQFYEFACMSNVEATGDVDLSRAVFHHGCTFFNSSFNGSFGLTSTSFNSSADFNGTTLATAANLRSAQFKQAPFLSGLTAPVETKVPDGWAFRPSGNSQGLLYKEMPAESVDQSIGGSL